MEAMMLACGFYTELVINKQIFRNFQFYTSKATLKSSSKHQLEEIAAALRQLSN